MIPNNKGFKVLANVGLEDWDSKDRTIQRFSNGLVLKKDRKCAHGISYNDDSIHCEACEKEVVEE